MNAPESASRNIFRNSVLRPRLGGLLLGLLLLVAVPCAHGAEPGSGSALGQALEQASTLLKEGKTQEAYTLYMRLLREEPGDPQVNLGLAKAAAALGEDNQAVLALERLVDAYPKDAGLRMELARLLIKTGNADAARREMELARRMDPSLTEELSAKVLDKLENEARRWQLSGRLSVGVTSDSNVNLGPQSPFLQFGLWTLRLDSSALSQSSWGVYSSAALDGGWRLGQDSPWWLVGDVGAYVKRYQDQLPSNQEMRWGRGALGLRYLGASTLLDVRFKSDMAEYVGDEQTAYSTGAELLWIWAVHPRVQLLSRAALERHTYRYDTGRQGWFTWGGQYIRLLFGDRGSDLTVGVRGLHGNSEYRDYRYKGWEGSVQASLKLPYAFELTPFVSYRQEYYTGPATALELANRKDENFRAGVGLCYRFSTHLSADINWQYSDNRSRSPLYTYSQEIFSAGLTWQF